jgi:hypothetical protein
VIGAQRRAPDTLNLVSRSLTLLLSLLLWPPAVSAQQVTEATGTRALGMGGAFVAVADDATAVYWNPAGLVKGPPAGMTVGWLDFRTGDQAGPPVAGTTSRTSKFVSLGSWPIGLSYGNFHENALIAAADGTMRGETLAISEFGGTFVQTLAQGLVLGGTARYLRGKVLSSPLTGQTARDALNAASNLDGPSTGRFDVDLGLMADFGKARLGLSMRNLRDPSFGDAETSITLRRHSRVGLAVLPITGLTLAVDLDLSTVDLQDGPRRILAMGGEDRLGRRWAVRSGVRWSVDGAKRTTAAVGASLAVHQGLWLDWQYTQGRLDGDRGFGVALRAGS